MTTLSWCTGTRSDLFFANKHMGRMCTNNSASVNIEIMIASQLTHMANSSS